MGKGMDSLKKIALILTGHYRANEQRFNLK